MSRIFQFQIKNLSDVGTKSEATEEGINDLNIFTLSDTEKLCEEALTLIGNVNDIFTLPLELSKSDERYRLPQKDVSNCSSSQIEESETVSPYCSNDEQKYDFLKRVH